MYGSRLSSIVPKLQFLGVKISWATLVMTILVHYSTGAFVPFIVIADEFAFFIERDLPLKEGTKFSPLVALGLRLIEFSAPHAATLTDMDESRLLGGSVP